MSLAGDLRKGLSDSAKDVAGSVVDAGEVWGNVSTTAGLLLRQEAPTAGEVARAAATDVGRTAASVTRNTAATLVVQSAVRRGVTAGTARVMGGGLGGLIDVGFRLGKLAVRREECTSRDVAKTATSAAVTGFLAVTCTPLVGGLLGTVVTPLTDKVIDAIYED